MRLERTGLLLLPLLLGTASVLLVRLCAPRVAFAETDRQHPETPTDAEGTALLSAMPVAFVPNVGQWDHPARHVVRLGAMTVLLQENGWMFTLSRSDKERTRGVAVCMTLAEPGTAELVAEQRLSGEHNYFLGNDPARWRTGVPRFGQVRYKAPWPGADVVCYEQHGRFEYDLVLAPGADLASMEIEVEGAERLWIDGDGALVIETAMGPVRQPKPVTWEVGPGGERRPLDAAHELRGASRFGFTAPGWSGECLLVLDPGLVYSTFVGGAADDRAQAVATDASGVVTIAGYATLSSIASYPTTPGAWNTSHNGSRDVSVSRLDPSLPAAQQLVWSTFVGGSGQEWAEALSVDASGVVTITGRTRSANYPTTPGAFDTTFNVGGYTDTFVTRLDPGLPAAQQLVYSTFLGGTSDDDVWGLSVDASGVVTVAGLTASADYPTTTGAFDTTLNGILDAFVARLDPSLTGSQQLVYSTFVGGTGNDMARALSMDASGVVTITGHTGSTDYPTTPGAFDTTLNGAGDVVVTRLDLSQPAAQQLVYSTFVGGTSYDDVSGLHVDVSGVVTVAGVTASANYPTTPGAFDTTFNGGPGDVLVTRLDPSRPAAQQLVYSTFLGGSGWEQGTRLACESSGVITVVGLTESSGYPTTSGAFDRTLAGRDAFVTCLDPARFVAQQLLYSTFIGGNANDAAHALALDASGALTIAGQTTSPDYPTTPGAYDPIANGSEDVFITGLDMLPTGVSRFGRSSPGCAGPLPISVTSMPSVGNAGFAITCGNAPPGSVGLLLAGGAGLAAPINVLGVELWIDPNPFLVTFSVTSNGVGAAEFALPIPGSVGLVGTRLFTQFGWFGPASPPPCPPLGISASNALDIIIQP